MKIALPAQFLGLKSRTDRTYKLEFNTRELRGQEAAALLGELMSECWLLISSNEDVTEADVPQEKADSGLGSKTPSQRLRGVLYILWEQNKKPDTFEQFYGMWMEKLIDKVKEKLDDQ